MINNENLDKLIEFVKSMKEDEIEDLEEALEELKKTNGKKANPFDVGMQDEAYYGAGFRGINEAGYWDSEDIAYHVPCKDKSIIKERQKRNYLNALLEKFAYENDAVVTEDMWNKNIERWYIAKSLRRNLYDVYAEQYFTELGTVCFATREIAERAIQEVVVPFMESKYE